MGICKGLLRNFVCFYGGIYLFWFFRGVFGALKIIIVVVAVVVISFKRISVCLKQSAKNASMNMTSIFNLHSIDSPGEVL